MAPRGLLALASTTLDQLSATTEALSKLYFRLSLRKTAPNLEIHLPFPDPRTMDSTSYFQSLGNLGRAIGDRG